MSTSRTSIGKENLSVRIKMNILIPCPHSGIVMGIWMYGDGGEYMGKRRVPRCVASRRSVA